MEPPSLEESVRASAAASVAAPRDGAALDLALIYARAIDAGGDLEKLGPCLLRTLDALGMTPKSRTAPPPPNAGGGANGDDNKPTRPLDELRNRRRTRADRAAAVDPTAT